MVEDDGLPMAPVFIEDLNAILGCDRALVLVPLLQLGLPLGPIYREQEWERAAHARRPEAPVDRCLTYVVARIVLVS